MAAAAAAAAASDAPEAREAAGAPGAAPKGFGSFHSASVEVLVRQGASEYRPPGVPEGVRLPSLAAAPLPAFGLEARRRWFLLDERWTFLNHGAFGAAMLPGLDAAEQWRRHAERQPLRFFDRELMPLLVAALRRLAPFVGARPEALAFVPNATAGLNAVLRSVPLGEGDRVVSLDIGYGAAKKMLREVCGRAGAAHDELEVPLPPAGPAAVVDAVRSYLDETPGVRLAVFDFVTSNTALRLPVEELVALCRARGVRVLIDGAHSLGQYPLNLDALGADYFVANAHKWLAAPKGCAFLWAAPAVRDAVHPLAVSHGHGSGFLSEFVWQGLADYSPFLALTAVLEAWELAGPARVRAHCNALALGAARMLASRWGTELLAPESMLGAMACVRVPGPPAPRHDDEHNELQDRLHHEHRIEVPVKKIAGRLYVRISAHIYNTMPEYERLADALLQLRGAP